MDGSRQVAGAPATARAPTAGLPLWAVPAVALGGALGTLARYGIGQRFPVEDGGFPLTTLIENVVGAALLAILLTVAAQRGLRRAWVGPLAATGVLGSFTTFSTFSAEVVLLVRDHRSLLAAAYVAATLALGLGAAAGSVAATRAWAGRR